MQRDNLIKSVRSLLPRSSARDPEKANYDPLLQTSDDESSIRGDVDAASNPERSRNRKSSVRTVASVFLKIVLVGLAIWGIANLGRRTFTIQITTPTQPSCSCGGDTVAEAKTRGCTFTELAISWLPPHCIDYELSEEFKTASVNGTWRYYRHLNATEPLSVEDISMFGETGEVFYTTQEWHVRHCMFMWKKHYRSQLTGVTVEARSTGVEHINHCEHVATNNHHIEDMFTVAGVALNADLG